MRNVNREAGMRPGGWSSRVEVNTLWRHIYAFAAARKTRAVRWAAVVSGPQVSSQPATEMNRISIDDDAATAVDEL